MIDLKFLRENPEIVKQNIKNKFQDQKEARVRGRNAVDGAGLDRVLHGDSQVKTRHGMLFIIISKQAKLPSTTVFFSILKPYRLKTCK